MVIDMDGKRMNNKFTSCHDCTERLIVNLRYCGRRCSHNPSNINYFRPKAEKKIIDLSTCVGSDIDMEFADSINVNDLGFCLTDTLNEDNTQLKGLYISKRELRGFEQCRVRQDHWHSWQGGECPLPDGLAIEIRTREKSTTSYNAKSYNMSAWGWKWNHPKRDNSGDIIAFKVLGPADGWCYSWDKS